MGPSNDDEKTLHEFLCSCLSRFLAYPVFTIFLSTNSSLVKFASPRDLARSTRIRGGLAVTHAPITETPFDCDDELMVKISVQSLSWHDLGGHCECYLSIQCSRLTCWCCRFWTLLRGAGMNAPEMHTEVMELAHAKLVTSCAIDSSYDTFPRVLMGRLHSRGKVLELEMDNLMMLNIAYVLVYMQYTQFILPILDVSFSGMSPNLSICTNLSIFFDLIVKSKAYM